MGEINNSLNEGSLNSIVWEINNRLNDIIATLRCFAFRFMLRVTQKEFFKGHIFLSHIMKKL